VRPTNDLRAELLLGYDDRSIDHGDVDADFKAVSAQVVGLSLDLGRQR